MTTLERIGEVVESVRPRTRDCCIRIAAMPGVAAVPRDEVREALMAQLAEVLREPACGDPEREYLLESMMASFRRMVEEEVDRAFPSPAIGGAP
jgi:translation elongation factor EF-Ts